MNTEVKIAGVPFRNPVMTASGTFGSGMEYGEFVDLNALGGVVTKGVSLEPWQGNDTPRVTETQCHRTAESRDRSFLPKRSCLSGEF